MKKTAPPTIVYVERNKLSLSTNLHLDPYVYAFPPTAFSDLEIINPQELVVGLRSFIEQNRIKPGPLVMFLSQSVYFEKNYTGQNPPTSEDQDNFKDTVPFSATSSKLFHVISGFKQVVLNRDSYEGLKNSFEDMGFSLIAVVPGFALGQNAAAGFTAESCKNIYHKLDQIIVNSIIGAKDMSQASLHEKEQVMLESHKLLVIVLIILILLTCGLALYMTFGRPQPVRKTAQVIREIPVLPTSTPEITPTPEIAQPTAQILESATVQILNASGRAGLAATVSEKFKSLGFTKIQTGNNTRTVQSSSLIFASQVATDTARFVENEVKNIFPDIQIQTDPQAKFDITVILGASTP